jgi:hypothetical protein
MDMSRLRELRLASPFREFSILLRNGTRLHVDEAHHMAIAPDGSRLGVFTAQKTRFIWPHEIQDVEVKSASGNTQTA